MATSVTLTTSDAATTSVTLTANNASTEYHLELGSRGPAGAVGATGSIGPSGPIGPIGPIGIGSPGAPGDDALWNYTGEYSGGAEYAIGDVATYDGETFYRKDAHGGNVGDTPFDGSDFWDLLAAKGDAGGTTLTAGDGIDITDNVISATGGTVDATIIDGSANAVSSNAVFDALALKAPLDSPVFTGSVTTSGDASIFTSGTYASIASYGDYAHIATYGDYAYIQSRATFNLHNGTYTTTLSHAPTANRNIAFPNATGTVALINPSSGTQTFSGAQIFTNSAIGTGTGVAISGTATSGTILAVSGTASTSGSLFTVTQGSIGFRITETGALNYNGVVSLSRSGGADISLGGVNNSNLIRSNNTGSNTATDFVLRGGTADRTAGNLFEVRNFTQPVLTISALTGAGNVGIGTTTPAEKLSVVGNATVSGSLTVSGSTQFASTTRPTSSGTGTPAATSLITLADGDSRYPVFLSAVATADLDRNSTITPTADPTLTLTLTAGTWMIRGIVYISESTVLNTFGARLNVSATGASASGSSFVVKAFAGSSPNSFTSVSAPKISLTTTFPTPDLGAATSSWTFEIDVLLVVASSATLDVNWAQFVSNATPTRRYKGSYLTAMKTQ